MVPKYSVVVPLFNEELVISESYKRLKTIMDGLGGSYEIIFVNDGSYDKTEKLVREICKDDANVKLINFSRNFGHQSAITAGMDHSNGDAIVIIDADLQDPPEVIPEMAKKWKAGFDVVYGKRRKRSGESFFKKATAAVYYRLLRSMTNVDIPTDVGDFRLIDRKVCDVLKSLPEKNRYVRGLVCWVGFKQTSVEYERDPRFAGDTKYSMKKMLKLASDGIASFSYRPLKFATFCGIFIIFADILLFVWVLATNHRLSSNMLLICLFFLFTIFSSGLILLSLGVFGEYVGRICDEARNRPNYIVRDVVSAD
jgi:dolichol-phosphate mannosyltransferase